MTASPHATSTPAPHQSALAPVYAQYPFEVARAEGVWLIGPRGERVLDLYGGHAVAALGYGHALWSEALAEQARSCQFQTNALPMSVREHGLVRRGSGSRLRRCGHGDSRVRSNPVRAR